MSEREKATVKELERIAHEMLVEMGGDIPSEYQAKLIGTMLAGVDALFAIRDGNAWRTIEDPQEIARQLLREVGIGDPKED